MASNDKHIRKNRHFIESLGHALAGVKAAFLHEGNFRREFAFAALVLLFAGIFHVSKFDWFVLIIAILLVLLSEVWNTVIENLVDLVVGRRFDAKAKVVKDMSAAAVLVAAVIAVVCGAYVFLPELIALIGGR